MFCLSSDGRYTLVCISRAALQLSFLCERFLIAAPAHKYFFFILNGVESDESRQWCRKKKTCNDGGGHLDCEWGLTWFPDRLAFLSIYFQRVPYLLLPVHGWSPRKQESFGRLSTCFYDVPAATSRHCILNSHEFLL